MLGWSREQYMSSWEPTGRVCDRAALCSVEQEGRWSPW